MIGSRHDHDRAELVLVTPGWKYLTFAFGPRVLPGDLYDVRDAQHPKLANLSRGLVFMWESTADELKVLRARGACEHRDLRRDALCTRSAASSAPAPPASRAMTMMSARATDSFTTSAPPSARRTGW